MSTCELHGFQQRSKLEPRYRTSTLEIVGQLEMAATKKGGAARKRKLEDVAEEPPKKSAKEQETEADAQEESADEEALNRVELVRSPRLLCFQQHNNYFTVVAGRYRWKVPYMSLELVTAASSASAKM